MRHTTTKYRRNIGRTIRERKYQGFSFSVVAVVSAAKDRRLLGKPLKVACQKYRKANVLLKMCAEAIPVPIPVYMRDTN